MTAWVSQIRKGLVELCILLVVEGEETYGYCLVQRLRGVPNLDFTEGTVYPALARLIEEGCIKVTEKPSPMGPRRRYLSLTAAGKRRLKEMCGHWRSVCGSIEALMRMLEKGQNNER